MPKRSGVMNERERAICRRTAVARAMQGLSQADFARLIGVTRDRLAAVEAGYSPLRFSVGQMICERCNLCQRWLADGTEPWVGRLVYPNDLLALIKQRALFSQAYDEVLRDESNRLIQDSILTAKGIARYQEAGGTIQKSAAYYADLLAAVWFERFDIAKHQELYGCMGKAGAEFYRSNAASIIRPAKGEGGEKGGKYFVDNKPDSIIVPGMELEVPTWLKLKKDIARLTAKRGQRAALADHFGVSRQAFGNWLSDDNKGSPNPDITLRLLKWVNDPERKTE